MGFAETSLQILTGYSHYLYVNSATNTITYWDHVISIKQHISMFVPINYTANIKTYLGLLVVKIIYLFLSCDVVQFGKLVDSSWNVMAHGDAREGKWRGNWRMEWVASTLHTTSEHGVSSITTADAHTSAASSRLNWRPPGRFKWTRSFRRKTKSGFCACAITF